jgi:hypothetical protein
MTNKEIKDKINEIKNNIKNKKLIFRCINDFPYKDIISNKNLYKKIDYEFYINYSGVFRIKICMYDLDCNEIIIFLNTNFKILRLKEIKKDKRNRLRKISYNNKEIVLEKIFYHKNILNLEITNSYDLDSTDKEIKNFFNTKDKKDFELILFEIVKKFILKKHLERVD